MFIHNNSEYDDTVFFNQTSSEINLDKSTRVLQSYIDNMSSETLIKTKIFKKILFYKNLEFSGKLRTFEVFLYF